MGGIKMPDGMVSKEVNDYIRELKRTFGKTFPWTDFWEYVVLKIAADPTLRLGEASKQTTRMYKLANDWADLVNSGKRVMPVTETANTIKLPDGTSITLGADKSPWEQAGLTEDVFKSKYPTQYQQVSDWVKTQKPTTPGTLPPTTDTSLLYGGLSTAEIEESASLQGITPQQWKTNWLNKEFPQEKDTTKLTAWEEAQLNQSNLDRQAALDKVRSEEGKSWIDLALQRVSTPLPDPQAETKKNQAIYQQVINELRAELNPTDFAQKYILDIKEKDNPYVVRDITGEERLQVIKGEREYIKGEKKYLKDRMANQSDPLLSDTKTTDLMNTYDAILSGLDRQELDIKGATYGGAAGMTGNTYLERLAEKFQEGVIGGFTPEIGQTFPTGSPYESAQKLLDKYILNPNSPEFQNLTQEEKNLLQTAYTTSLPQSKTESTLYIPEWLRKSISGSPRSIKGLNWQEAITPSGQTFFGWNPTQQSIWSSYVKASGGSANDLIAHMQTMLPSKYSTASWRTASQI